MTQHVARFRITVFAATLAVAALASPASSPATAMTLTNAASVGDGTWVDVGPLPYPREDAELVRLPSGRVLVIGGGNSGDCCCIRRVDMYKPRISTWVRRTPMPHARCSPAVRLAGGRVLVAGGEKLGHVTHNTQWIRTAEIYDPRTDAWTRTTPMQHRGAVGGVRLTNGNVLMISGLGKPGWAEIYHPRTARWTVAATPVGHHQQMVRMRHGGVLAFGWTYRRSEVCFERYSARRDVWRAVAHYRWPCPSMEAATWVMPDGRVLVQPGRRQVHVYHPTTDRWSSLPPIPVPRQRQQLQIYGFVGAAGQPMALASKAGCSPAGGTTVGYRWQPSEHRWQVWTTLSDGALGIAMAKLRDGSVLIAGGVRWFRSCAIGGDHIPSFLAYRYYPDR